MLDYEIILPSKPRIVLEEENKGVYEIDGLYAGYGHTLGNSLRRIILSSLPGTAITTVKINGVNHEFSTIPGIKEDVVMILLNLKQIRLMSSDISGIHTATISAKGQKNITAADLKVPSQITVLNKDKKIATLTAKTSKLELEVNIESGLGYVPKEVLKKEKIETGTMILDAVFTPVRRVNYEVENMRVGEKTDYNRLRFFVETDGSISPREALENAIKILIKQLSAIVGFSEEETGKIIEETSARQKEDELKQQLIKEKAEEKIIVLDEGKEEEKKIEEDFLKTRIEDLDLSNRTMNSLSKAGIRTVGGLARKREEDLLKVEGIGGKSINEIKRALGNFGLILK